MTDDIRARSIDDLEVSVRSYQLLQDLGVTTVGELADLPRIVIPEDWPRKIAQLVAAELKEVLGELGIEYAGELVVPRPVEAKLKATGDVAARWTTIAAWLAEEQPGALAQFKPPAAPAAIAEAEKALGHTLPDDYKQFLLIHDGQEDLATMVGMGSLLPIAEVVEAKQNIVGEPVPVDEDGVDDGVRALDYCAGWIPISRSARGRDYLCLDLDPAPGGTRGQIVEYIVDDNARRRIAPSFADLLALYFEQAQTGELDFEADDDLDDDDA